MHNWDDMPGVRVTDDHIGLMEPDLLGRNDFSLEEQRSTGCPPGGL